ncbi:unnamed protein product [Prunus armeniaca]
MDPSLYEAARSGDVGLLKIVKKKATGFFLQKTPKGNNVLHIAAEFKQIAFFISTPLDDQQCRPLFWAANNKGNTPLHVAARVGSDEIVEFLIEHAKKPPPTGGADLESGGEAHKELLERTNMEKETALHVALRYGNQRVAHLLIAANPELTCLTNMVNESPLFLATSEDYMQTANMILKHCPESSFQGVNGVTALHAVVTHKSELAIKTLKLMIRKNGDAIKEADAIGWTPLHYAALKGNLEATKLLLEKDDVSASYMLDKSGMSALHVAAFAGHKEVMEELIRRHPDICDLVNHKGQTALHIAVLAGQETVVKYILKEPNLVGIIHEKDQDGNTALHLAAINQDYKIMKLLAADGRLDNTAFNRQLLKAADIFHSGKLEEQGICHVTTKLSKLLGKSIGVQSFQQGVNFHFWRSETWEREASNDTPQSQMLTLAVNVTAKKEKPQVNAEEQPLQRRDTRLLIATLILGISFAAAITVPGGTRPDGRPVLQGKPAYSVYLICNWFSFMVSALTIYNDILERKVVRIKVAAQLIQWSVSSLIIAFVAAAMATAAKDNNWMNFRFGLVLATGSTTCFFCFFFSRCYPRTGKETNICLRDRVI